MTATHLRHEPRPWRRATAWLVGLGIFFYASYGLANWLATQRADVPSIVFGWEQHIPFIAWTILPYWSVNLFYCASLFVCATRHELAVHARRLLTAQLIAVSFFIVMPLAFSFGQPQASGLPGVLFDALRSFDRPYNQAPSLHIALLVILWALYSEHLGGIWRWLLHGWFVLVGLSVLTTWQHHFFDIPTGALLGLLCLWLWPMEGVAPLSSLRMTNDRRRLTLCAYYAIGALLLVVVAGIGGGTWLWLLYPACSLGLVAANYLVIGAVGFQKYPHGYMSVAARLLLLPYLVGAWINSRLWTRGQPDASEIVDGVWLGRFPTSASLNGRFTRVIDVTAELPAPETTVRWFCQPMLDLVDAPPADVAAAAAQLDVDSREGPVLVACALGYSRSAGVIALWLLRSGRATDIDEAIAMIATKRPGIRLHERHRRLIAAAMHEGCTEVA
ncbi:dual specificity protein phosphatase family protein [Halomonas huangheensis]|uniref:Tyrosine specific protein phosphatases domain-containing protein n=1 Tax=Halomonas huangheensis TaxID=1178482 RepID=W1N7W1_9GAMM|nr:dual specificity protein phosphatase family protein [Halomonas huangheensis]ALM53332.1 serine/threonine protein phosphatase [Halomonas huangheensis]ERL51647.1 hypothetical protein BJB45_12725 [Halomonas huangheensis]